MKHTDWLKIDALLDQALAELPALASFDAKEMEEQFLEIKRVHRLRKKLLSARIESWRLAKKLSSSPPAAPQAPAPRDGA